MHSTMAVNADSKDLGPEPNGDLGFVWVANSSVGSRGGRSKTGAGIAAGIGVTRWAHFGGIGTTRSDG